jgi:hypothetical protein
MKEPRETFMDAFAGSMALALMGGLLRRHVSAAEPRSKESSEARVKAAQEKRARRLERNARALKHRHAP